MKFSLARFYCTLLPDIRLVKFSLARVYCTLLPDIVHVSKILNINIHVSPSTSYKVVIPEDQRKSIESIYVHRCIIGS